MENNPEAGLDKSKPWSRSIEDLHGGNALQSPITVNGITRVGRHSTLRYGGHANCRSENQTRNTFASRGCVCVVCDFLVADLFCSGVFLFLFFLNPLRVKLQHCDRVVNIFQSHNSRSVS